MGVCQIHNITTSKIVDKTRKSGFRYRCKKCRKEAAHRWYVNHREEYKPIYQAYRESHREENKIWQRNYRERNPEHTKRLNLESRLRQAKRNPYRKRAISWRKGMALRAEQKNLLIDLHFFTIEYLTEWQKNQQSCPICNNDFDFGFYKTNIDRSPSLDRVDSSRGYVHDNVAMVCCRCNVLKGDGTAEEHIKISEWMKKMEGET